MTHASQTPCRRPHRALFAAAALTLLASACGETSSETTQSDNLTIAATTSIWADVVANVACDGPVDVLTIIPTGADPHAFEASLADRGLVDDADLVVANGLGLEEGLVDTIEASDTPVFAVSDHLSTIAFAAPSDTSKDADHDEDHGDEDHADEDSGDEHDHHHDGDDPHVWMDPTRVASMLPALAEALAEAGMDPEIVQECAASYQEDLVELDQAIAAMTMDLSDAQRTLVTAHDALGYFADRYDFELIGTVIPAGSTLAETNPAQLESLAALIEQYEVPAIFTETQQGNDDVEALAARAGDIEVVALFTGTLGEPGSGADTYLGMLQSNAERLVEALR